MAGFWHPALGACLAGGEGPGGTNAEVECVDGDRVRALPPLNIPRHGLGAAVINDAIHVVLGGPNPGLFVSAAVETLDLRAAERSGPGVRCGRPAASSRRR